MAQKTKQRAPWQQKVIQMAPAIGLAAFIACTTIKAAIAKLPKFLIKCCKSATELKIPECLM
jgi:hypothetical protein